MILLITDSVISHSHPLSDFNVREKTTWLYKKPVFSLVEKKKWGYSSLTAMKYYIHIDIYMYIYINIYIYIYITNFSTVMSFLLKQEHSGQWSFQLRVYQFFLRHYAICPEQTISPTKVDGKWLNFQQK